MILALILMLTAIVLTGMGQVALKIGSNADKGRGFWDPYLNTATVAGYSLYLISTVFLYISLREIPLKLFGAMSSFNFIIILLLTSYYLHERITPVRIFAILLIVAGVMVFNIPQETLSLI